MITHLVRPHAVRPLDVDAIAQFLHLEIRLAVHPAALLRRRCRQAILVVIAVCGSARQAFRRAGAAAATRVLAAAAAGAKDDAVLARIGVGNVHALGVDGGPHAGEWEGDGDDGGDEALKHGVLRARVGDDCEDDWRAVLAHAGYRSENGADLRGVNMVWQPMMKMICIGPNCVMPIERRERMADASLPVKMTVAKAMLRTSVMLAADASRLTVLNCSYVMVPMFRMLKRMLRMVTARRMATATVIMMPFEMLMM